MNQELLKKLAMLMYDNYCMAVGGKAFNGDNLPTSEEFFSDPSKQKQINGWMSAAAASVTFAETTPEIITDGPLRQKADKWDGLKGEIDAFYCDENGDFSESNPVRTGDLANIGEVAASWTGWL